MKKKTQNHLSYSLAVCVRKGDSMQNFDKISPYIIIFSMFFQFFFGRYTVYLQDSID